MTREAEGMNCVV